ncbi:uncharacterized protein LOC131239045 [Magnolia sinica]|uniref:uncharacterized protein LOC131239045 n=1 Tax=Magnolia sinica TaxID=86752 RepID=UPI00265A2FD7|nr:uncharacterized protein LOC131239045 [Magnolia sinica]
MSVISEQRKLGDSFRGCRYCKRAGHEEQNCFKKMRDEGRPIPNRVQQANPPTRQNPQGRLYAIMSPKDANPNPNLIEGTTFIQNFPIVLLFDCGATISFISNFIVERLNLELKYTKELITVASPQGNMIELNKYYEHPITIADVDIPVDLVKVNMKGFDVILGMDWLD